VITKGDILSQADQVFMGKTAWEVWSVR
jgi:hypothetical protein